MRLAQSQDRFAVETIVEAAYSHYIARIGQKPGPMLDDYAALIEGGHVHVMDDGKMVVGILVLIQEADTMLLDNVALHPSAQGRGLGRQLLAFAEQTAREAGCGSIRLYTHVLMTENIAIYTRAGYHETHRGEQKGLQRVFMTKSLAES
jgi:GNAT superfamily N-acetyltransferase